MRGSGATIYEADVDGWSCAVKEITGISMLPTSTVAAFEKEIKMLSSLPQHPNVCRYLFSKRDKDTIRLFMTLYHTTLSAVILKRKTEIAKLEEATMAVTSSDRKNSTDTIDVKKFVQLFENTISRSNSRIDDQLVSFPGSNIEGDIIDCVVEEKPCSKSNSYVARPPVVQYEQYFTPNQVVSYTLQILFGLQYLHAHSIIHRDVKSENMFAMLDTEGNIKRLAIGDFDTAKYLGNGRTQSIVGTPGWVAPEVFKGEDYSFGADIFSLGVVMYQMMAFQMPWGSTPIKATNYEERIANPLPFPAHVTQNSDLAPLVDMCYRCLSMNPADRPTLKEIKEGLMTSGNFEMIL
eukprot:TRINITY_DN3859_c0_g1_i2.p1 TRINITY_DN3859_c0_g1~~TRINITY_DN3859_c0_g1_i2.p1  ORF type:complete len:350 (+),score=84.95 TRINITY_DN3859_c0_g1_i2:66-1115(+)